MEYQGSSSAFWATGKIEDYLKYSEERKRQACEKFISAIEGEKANDRNSNSNWNGNNKSVSCRKPANGFW